MGSVNREWPRTDVLSQCDRADMVIPEQKGQLTSSLARSRTESRGQPTGKDTAGRARDFSEARAYGVLRTPYLACRYGARLVGSLKGGAVSSQRSSPDSCQ